MFGAPEVAAAEPDHDPKFLVVQPNHEVQVYLNAADASAVWPLAQLARRVSGAGEVVQTFAGLSPVALQIAAVSQLALPTISCVTLSLESLSLEAMSLHDRLAISCGE